MSHGFLQSAALRPAGPSARPAPTRAAVSPETADTTSADWTLRRWDVARTNRLNAAHWARATGQSLNADLAGHLRNLRIRCCHEASNNPIVEGLIHSHAADIVGESGPTLQVLSDSQEYNDALEALWRDWWNPPYASDHRPDVANVLTGPDLLRQCVWLWWTKGEHLLQLTSAPDAPADELSLRIASIDPDRLDTDPRSGGDGNVVLGVRRNRVGRPLAYQICETPDFGPFRLLGGHFQSYSADEIIHQFEAIEPGQARGVPWLTSCLQTVADLRDFDAQVLDAARLAASQGVVWYTDHDDAPFVLVNEETQLERNTERTGPPGWKPMMIDPKQPAANYVEFRTERLRELGRARSIPLMKILLGSEKHNFASARMDNQNYQRACSVIQAWTERQTLLRILAAVVREGQLLRRRGRYLLPPPPTTIVAKFLWPKQPHVDPKKEADAERVQLENGTLPFAEACAANGRDEDAVITSRARTAAKLAAAGLPPVPTPNLTKPSLPEDDSNGASPHRDGAGTRSIDPDDDGFDALDDGDADGDPSDTLLQGAR